MSEKIKKPSKAMLLARADELLNMSEQYVEDYKKANADKFKSPPVTVYMSFVQNSTPKRVRKCARCGYTEIIEPLSSCEKSQEVCKGCGSENVVVAYKSFTNTNFAGYNSAYPPFFCKKEGDFFIIATITESVAFNQENSADVEFEENGTNDFLTDLSLKAHCDAIVVFHKDLGFRHDTANGISNFSNFCKGDRFYSLRKNLTYQKFVLTTDTHEFKAIVEEKVPNAEWSKGLYYIALKYNETLTRKTVKKEIDVDSIIGPFDKEKILNAIATCYHEVVPSIVQEKTLTHIKYVAGCTCLGYVEDVCPTDKGIDLQKVKTTCKFCGQTITTNLIRGPISRSIKNTNENEVKARGIYWQQIKDGFSILFVYIEMRLNKKTYEIEYNLSPSQVCLLYPKKFSAYTHFGGQWESIPITRVMQWSLVYNNMVMLNTPEELQEMIKDSFLKYSGVEHAWGLGEYEEFATDIPGKFDSESYLYTWYKKPYVEKLVKAKLRHIISDVIYNHFTVKNPSGDSIYDILGISKAVFRATRENNWNWYNMECYQELCELSEGFPVSEFMRLKNNNVNTEKLAEVCRNTDTSLTRLVEYLDSCYDYQCIQRKDALTIFEDYYRMAKSVGFNLEDKHIKFPNSLKKEHDKATFAFKVIDDEGKKKMFQENVEKSKKFAFEDNEFAIVFPEGPDDVVREGQVLSHCVSSYVSKIENGETIIVFLRRKQELDQPYYTCEIYKGKLYQVKGYCNCLPNHYSERKLIKFLDNWCERYNLKKEYSTN